MSWQSTKLSEFLSVRDGRIKYETANQLGLQRIKKIDFSGNIHLSQETDSKTDMIRVKSGDLVISGINAAKGAIAVHAEEDDVLATIHYSAYEFNSDKISVDFLKWFFKSPEFTDLLREQIPGGIKTELKPKHILPLEIKLPKLSEQISIAERLNGFYLKHLELEHEIDRQQSLLTKLKQAILQEAIQGKITADWRAANPDTEPASELLKRIQTEKARLVAAKKLKKEKPLPPIKPEEIPFEIPKSWEWCRFANIQTGADAGSSPKCEERPVVGDEWGILKVSATSGACFRQNENKFFKTEVLENHSAILQEGDFILSRANTKELVGNSVLVEGLTLNLLLSDKTIRFRISKNVNPSYVNLVNKAEFVRTHFITNATGASPSMKNLSRDSLISHLFPLPPLAEQANIVERVEALMESCRDLETEIENARTHASQLLQSILKEAFAPAS